MSRMRYRSALHGKALAVALAIGLALAATVPVPVGAQPQEEQAWKLTTADFATRRVRLGNLSGEAAHVVEADGQSAQIAIARMVRLERLGAAPVQGGDAPFVLHTRGGDRLSGQPVRLTETALVMQTPLLGEVEIPLEQLLALARRESPADGAWRQPAPAADEILLANGDQLRGYVAAIDHETWKFADERGNETPLAAAAVKQLRFADPGVAAAATPQTGWRAHLADGSLLTLSEVALSEGEFSLAYLGRTVKQPEASVAWLEPVAGPVRWLADLPMAEAVHTPYLTAGFPSLAEAPADAGARSFAVRSRSRLSFDIPPGFGRLRARYAMDRHMTQGSVDVRILLDDQVAHEHRALTAADSPEPVELPLGNARRLTLEVDYGPGLDVQDVLHWIEPALVKG